MAYPTYNQKAMAATNRHTVDVYGQAQQNASQSQQLSNQDASKQLNGTPRARLLTVDEALQYSPLSSISPFSSSKSLLLNETFSVLLTSMNLLRHH